MSSSQKTPQIPVSDQAPAEKFDNLDAFETQQALADMLDAPIDARAETSMLSPPSGEMNMTVTTGPADVAVMPQGDHLYPDETGKAGEGRKIEAIREADDRKADDRKIGGGIADNTDAGDHIDNLQDPESQMATMPAMQIPAAAAPPANPFEGAANAAHHTRMVEALLFAATEPLDQAGMKARLPDDIDLPAVLETLRGHYQNRGINLIQTGQKYLFVTAPDMAPLLADHRVQPKKLSRAAMETLAIIAYHQPCTRAEIEEIRGVSVSKGSLDLLLEIGWLRLRGRRDTTPGRPLLYGTSAAFLEHFGLEKTSHLPGMADLKAAGLLDARLPPGFEIPQPRDDETDGDDPVKSHDEEEDDSQNGTSPEFMHDFFKE